MQIRKNDSVMVIAGKERGKTGKVLRVNLDKNAVIIERVNLVKRHTKARGPQQPGGIVEKEAAIHISNLGLLDPKDGKPTRVGYKILEDGRKVRFARRSGEVIDR